MTTEEQITFVEAMLRVLRDCNIRIPLSKVGIYQVISSPANHFGDRKTIGLFEGRLIDVMIHATTLEQFHRCIYGSWDTNFPDHGYVLPYKLQKIRVRKGNDQFLKIRV